MAENSETEKTPPRGPWTRLRAFFGLARGTVDAERKGHSSPHESIQPAASEILGRRIGAYLDKLTLVTSRGHIKAVDVDLSAAPPFQPAELARRKTATRSRWADVHAQEVDREMAALVVLRDRFADLAYRSTIDTIAQYELDEIETVHADEIAAGWYTIQSDVAALEQQAQAAWADGAQKAFDAIDGVLADTEIVDWDQQTADKFAAFKAGASYISHFSIYNKAHKDNAPTAVDANWIWTIGDTIEPPFDRPAVLTAEAAQSMANTHPMPDKLWGMLIASELPETMLSFATINSQHVLANGAAASAQFTAAAKDRLSKWHADDVQFRKARTQITLDANKMRQDARILPRAPLNTAEQLNEIRVEFTDRLADIFVRCEAIVDGFDSIWGIAGVPALPDVLTWNEQTGSYFEALLKFCRELKRVISSTSVRELNSVVPLSIAGLMGGTEWRDTVDGAIANGDATIEFLFPFPESLANPLRMPRTRGVVAYARGVSDHVAGPWRATLKPPETAASTITAAGTISQDALLIDLCRIQTREYPRPPDVVGLASIRNIVPCTVAGASTSTGLWTLTLEAKSLRGHSAADLIDIELDLLLAGKAA